MKTLRILLVGLLCCPNFVVGEEPPLPPEIRTLQIRRNEEIAKINNLYVKALEMQRDKYTKAVNLANANLAQRLIDEIRSQKNELSASLPVQKSASPPVQELLTESKWTVNSVNHNYKVVFQEGGVALRDDTKQRLWKWNIDGKILWCYWFTSGWVQFEVPDDPKSNTWIGKSKGGERFTLSRVSM